MNIACWQCCTNILTRVLDWHVRRLEPAHQRKYEDSLGIIDRLSVKWWSFCQAIVSSGVSFLHEHFSFVFFSFNIASWERRISPSQVCNANSPLIPGENELRESLSFFDYWLMSVLYSSVFSTSHVTLTQPQCELMFFILIGQWLKFVNGNSMFAVVSFIIYSSESIYFITNYGCLFSSVRFY